MAQALTDRDDIRPWLRSAARRGCARRLWKVTSGRPSASTVSPHSIDSPVRLDGPPSRVGKISASSASLPKAQGHAQLTEGPLIFPTLDGGPSRRTGLSIWGGEPVEALGLPDVTFHSLEARPRLAADRSQDLISSRSPSAWAGLTRPSRSRSMRTCSNRATARRPQTPITVAPGADSGAKNEPDDAQKHQLGHGASRPVFTLVRKLAAGRPGRTSSP